MLTFSRAVARMTSGPRTAYSIFFTLGFMLSRVSAGEAVAAMLQLETVVARAERERRKLGLKLIIATAGLLLLF